LRNIAQRHGVSLAALHRHKAHIAAAVQAQQVLTVERLLSDLADLQQRALALLAKAEQAGDLRAALAAIREAREVITGAARLIEQGELAKRLEALEQTVQERLKP
jgi:hypothetical protein